MRSDRIRIFEYDARWAELFEQERARLEPVLRDRLTGPVEHIGSTAVPGLPAKPIIDMLAVVDDYAACAEVFDRLTEMDWLVAPEPGDQAARKWSLCHPDAGRRTHHLHLVEQGSPGWQTWLAFRDHLRVSPEDRAEYARIKRELASTDDQDRPAYRAGKAPFITDVLARADPWSARPPSAG